MDWNLIAVAALRFLYKVSLHKDWTFEDVMPVQKKPQKLPIVLSPEEVLQLVDPRQHQTPIDPPYLLRRGPAHLGGRTLAAHGY
jgi:site-specific recombinase XerD